MPPAPEELDALMDMARKLTAHMAKGEIPPRDELTFARDQVEAVLTGTDEETARMMLEMIDGLIEADAAYAKTKEAVARAGTIAAAIADKCGDG